MKIFSTIFLIIPIFIQTFSSYIIEADFFLNRSYIAENLCVNKERPMMKCSGKCYLTKKLKEQEKQDQQAPLSKSERFEIAPFFVPSLFVLAPAPQTPKSEFIIEDDCHVSSLPRNIFRPPSTAMLFQF